MHSLEFREGRAAQELREDGDVDRVVVDFIVWVAVEQLELRERRWEGEDLA